MSYITELIPGHSPVRVQRAVVRLHMAARLPSYGRAVVRVSV